MLYRALLSSKFQGIEVPIKTISLSILTKRSYFFRSKGIKSVVVVYETYFHLGCSNDIITYEGKEKT